MSDVASEAPNESRMPTMVEILRAAAQYFSVPSTRLRNGEKHMQTVHARHVAMFLCRVDARRSYPEIGKFFGAHHTTVIDADRKIFAKRAGGDVQLEKDLKSVREILARVLSLPTATLAIAETPPACRNCQKLREEIARTREEVLMLRQDNAVLKVRFGCD